MRSVRQLLKFFLVDGALATVALVLVSTFAVHLLFAWMPAPVEEGYRVRVGSPLEQEGDDPVQRLRLSMRREAHTRWLREGGDRVRVGKRLLAEYLHSDLVELQRIRSAEAVTEPGATLAYGRWLGKVARRDLGYTRSGLPVAEELRLKAPLTIKLSVTAYFLALVLGVAIALVRTERGDLWPVRGLHYVGYLLTTLPPFFLGYLVISQFRLDLSDKPSLLPAILTLTLSSAIINEVDRTTHHAMVGQSAEEYIRTARVKGLKLGAILPIPGTVTFHAFRQAAVQFLPRLASRVPIVVGMSIIVEKVFVLEGLGDMLIDGLAYRDESRVLAVVLVTVAIVQLCVIATRAGHLLLDPRARLSDGRA